MYKRPRQYVDITFASHRRAVIDRVVSAALKLKLQHETLHIAVNIFDRYMARDFNREDVLLKAVTCLYIASKFEENYYPLMKNFVAATGDLFEEHQVR